MSTDDSAGAGPPAAASTPADPPPVAVPAGPPWSVDLLADLHAGCYPAEVADRLRQQITSDPWAASVLAALDATVDGLSLLPVPRMPERFALRLDAAIADEYRAAGRATDAAAAPGQSIDRAVPQPRQAVDQTLSPSRVLGHEVGRDSSPQRRPFAGPPVVPMQPGLPTYPAAPPPARPSTAGASAADRPTSVPPAAFGPAQAFGPPQAFVPPQTFVPPPTLVPPPTVPPPTSTGPAATVVRSLDVARARRRRWVGGLAAAAAVAAIGTGTVLSLHHPAPTTSQAGVAPAPAASALQLDAGDFGDALKKIEGRRPAGPLQDAATYSRCLAANAIDPSAVSGVASATFQGKPAAAIAVVVDAGHSKVVVVGPGCGVDGAADQLASTTVPR